MSEHKNPDFEGASKFILNKLKLGLSPMYTYHCVDHILDVWNAVKMYAAQEKISADETMLVETAALFHDSGFLVNPHEHEQTSCEMVKNVLPSFGYSLAQIDLICGMILATKIPQNPKTHLEQILADADLDYMGRDDYDQIRDELYHEFSNRGISFKPWEWTEFQLKFLTSHHYFTSSAVRLREEGKNNRIHELENLLTTQKLA